ncbi:MAG: hypothetical protein HYX78_15790 [Armatimonadetes bacterium]|nr:hypothetical protein [Armatimonadota bacterium]
MNRRFDEKNQMLIVDIPMRLKKRGGRRHIIVSDRLQTAETKHDYSESLALAITRSHRWKELIDSGRFSSISELAQAICLDVSYAARLYRLTLLAPDIIEAILDGNEPDGLSMRVLSQPIPLDWKAQRKLLGFERGNSQAAHPLA